MSDFPFLKTSALWKSIESFVNSLKCFFENLGPVLIKAVQYFNMCTATKMTCMSVLIAFFFVPFVAPVLLDNGAKSCSVRAQCLFHG